jgi:flagellar motility protein MotE (MotC chaperone)
MSVKKIIILAGVAILGFAGSFMITLLLSGSGDQGANKEEEIVSAEAGVPLTDQLRPNEKMIDELTKELRHQISELKREKQQFEEEQKRHRIASEELQKQIKELERLRVQLVNPITQLKEAQAEAMRSRVVIAQQEEDNLKRIATIYEKMDAVKGSEKLTTMCENGQENDVVKILHYMSDRTAAKLIAEIDKDIAARLCEKMKKITKQEG